MSYVKRNDLGTPLDNLSPILVLMLSIFFLLLHSFHKEGREDGITQGLLSLGIGRYESGGYFLNILRDKVAEGGLSHPTLQSVPL